jgi:NAD(P)-dependent dehydrogenase (short-subunit alcohol dehydrogenase family)
MGPVAWKTWPQTMTGKTAVISGSSKGIGAEVAAELSHRGANIVLNYPTPNLQSECDEVGAKLVTEWISVCADLSTVEGPEKLVQEAVARFKYIDILVNNAGYVPLAPVWDCNLEMWEKAMNLNARGAFLLTQAALPHLTPYRQSGNPEASGAIDGSRIIIVGSAASRLPRVGQGIYAATKGALDSMLRVWAQELPPKYGCTVNAVGPGPVMTDTFKNNLGDHFDEVAAAAAQVTPVEGSFASVQDVAWTVAFFAEERSRFINGVFMLLSGGRYLQ